MCQDKNEVVDYYRYVNIPGSLRAPHDLSSAEVSRIPLSVPRKTTENWRNLEEF